MRTRSDLSVHRFLRATRMLTLDCRSEDNVFTRDLHHSIRLHLVRLKRLTLRSKEGGFLLTNFRHFVLLIFLSGRVVGGVTICADRTGLFRLLFRRTRRHGIRLSVRRRRVMSFAHDKLCMTMLLVFVINVRVGRVSVLVHLIVFGRHLVLFRDVVFTIYVNRGNGVLNSVVRVFLHGRSMISRSFRIVPLFLGLFAIVLRSELRAI